MLSRKSPHNVRNGPSGGSVSPLSTQPKGDCSIAEPSGRKSLILKESRVLSSKAFKLTKRRCVRHFTSSVPACPSGRSNHFIEDYRRPEIR